MTVLRLLSRRIRSITRLFFRTPRRVQEWAQVTFRRTTERERDDQAGLDFHSIIQPEDVGLNGSVAFRSSPSGNQFLFDLLSQLDITDCDSIIDIGCGKGSAMRIMLRFPFIKVHGIELSIQIAAIARQNFQKLRAHRCEVIVGDAAAFKSFDEYNFVYFYNPFPASVMTKVISSLQGSFLDNPRELVIVYNNATCHEIVIREGIFELVAVLPDEWGNGISIYTNRQGGLSRLRMLK